MSEQGFAGMAIGAALAGRRPVIEFQIPSLLFLVFEQIANQAHKLALMTGGQLSVPVTYVVPSSGSRDGWAGQHSDHPYSLLAHVGVKTVVPALPSDAYGLLRAAIQDPDPTVVFAPASAMGSREAVEISELAPVPLGSAREHRASAYCSALSSCSPASLSRSAPCHSTCGLRTSTKAPRHRSPPSLPRHRKSPRC